MAAHAGKKVYKIRVAGPGMRGNILCERCWNPMEMVEAVYGKVCTFRGVKEIKEEEFITPEGKVLIVEVEKRKMVPSFKDMRVCGKCSDSLLESVRVDREVWMKDPKKVGVPFTPYFTPITAKQEFGLSPSSFPLDPMPSKFRSGKWKTWKKI